MKMARLAPVAVDDLAFTFSGMDSGTFVIGAPAFFGRKIFFGLLGKTVDAHVGPFYAL